MVSKNVIPAILALCLCSLPGQGAQRASENFVGVLYECNSLPNEATPPWDSPIGQEPNLAANYAHCRGGILDIDVMKSGNVAWYLAGYGGYYYRDPSWPDHNYHFAGASNPWQPVQNTGYTVEISVKVVDSNPGPAIDSRCFTLGMCEGDKQADMFMQIFKDKITSTYISGGRVLMYTGNLTDRFHKIRVVRDPGAMDDPWAWPAPQVRLYVDGVLVYTGGRVDDGGPLFYGVTSSEDFLFLGSYSAMGRYHVKVDYVRADLTGPYEPPTPAPACGDFGYLKGDFNRDCVVNFPDMAFYMQTWLGCTNPADLDCIAMYRPYQSTYRKDSQDFPFKYEGNVLPTQAAKPWDLDQADQSIEAQRCSTNGDLLDINTFPAGSGYQVGWWLPGPGGGTKALTANRHYPAPSNPDSINNPWAADIYKGYTVEVRLQVLDSVDDIYGFNMYFAEGHNMPDAPGAVTGYGHDWDISFFKNKIINGYSDHGWATKVYNTVLYNGDLSDSMHKVRFVRYWGASTVGHNPHIEIYVDDVLVKTTGWAYGGGIMDYCTIPEDWLFMGSLFGNSNYRVKIDYVRADFSGAYTPVTTAATPVCGSYGYQLSDINADCNTDFKDFAMIVRNWFKSTNPADPLKVNCAGGANAGVCEQ